MHADPAPRVATTGSTTSIVDEPDACLALLRILADGARHSWAELAGAVLGDTGVDAVTRIEAALEAFESTGMDLRRASGFVRASPFGVLDGTVIGRGLPHWHVRVAGSTGSTNADLLRTVRDEPSAIPRLITSEFQHAGRGRRGRRWASAPGISLTASFALRVERRLAALDGVTLVCGLAVRDVALDVGVAARLKWPNDVVVAGRKLGGILVEAHDLGDAAIVVVGVGLNVAAVAGVPAAGLPATDLATSGATSSDRNALAVAVAEALERRLAVFSPDGFAAFVDEWNEADAFCDAAVVVRGVAGDAIEPRYGVARGVDATGALLLDRDGIRTRVISGDVSLRLAEARP